MIKYTTPLFCAALGAVIGFYILGAEITAVSLSVTAVILVIACFTRSISSLYETSRVLKLLAIRTALLCSGLVFGICAANTSRNVIKLGVSENKITAIKGLLLEDPRVISNGNVIIPLSLRECAGNNGARVSASGEIPVFFPTENAQRLREFGRGSLVYTEGTIRASRTGMTFNAQSAHIVKPASNINQLRTGIRLYLMSRFEGTSWGGLALALLLGIRDNLDSDLAEHYRNAGCSFILALSGMHLAVIVSIIAFFLKKPLGMKGAAVTGASIIILYCFIVGPTPSLNRAALMYLLGVITILGALPKDPLQILSLSFLIQIAVFPAQGNSISFILSYLALAGILITGYPVYAVFSGYIPYLLLKPLSVSLGAFLATAGVTAFSFGFISPVGILAGLVLAPLTTVFMAASMFSLLPGLFFLDGLIDKLLSLLYISMEKIVTLASYVPGITSNKPVAVIVSSVFLSLGIIVLERKRREETLNPLPLA
jgi:competence protein ComEC